MIPVNEPLLGGNEKEYLIECVDSGWLSSEGPFVRKFQQQFASKVGREYGIAVCNGSVALDIAVAALDIGPGDEVIMPSFTIISCGAAVIRSGAVPVLVDSDPLTWNMDVTQVEEKITAHTKAIMVVHTYGLPVDMDPVMALARKYGLKIIEDAAEAHGQEYKGRPCGSFGDISTFSFYPNKLITTGEGGMVLVDEGHLAERCRSLHNLCFQPERRFLHEELGWNFRMSNVQAAVGLAQLEQIDEFVIKKRHLGQVYTKLLSGIPGLQTPVPKTTYAANIYWVYGIVLDYTIPLDSEEVMKRLAERQIGTRPFFWPMHEQPVFKKMGLFKNTSLPVSERLARRGLYLPSGLAITDEQIGEVCHAMRDILFQVGC